MQMPSEGSQWKGCQLCHLNPSVLWKRENYGDSAKISCCQGLGQEGMTRGSQQATETVPCDIITDKKSLSMCPDLGGPDPL